MKTADVVAYYGNLNQARLAIGLSSAAPYLWGEIVPLTSAYLFNKESRGALKLDMSLYIKDKIPNDSPKN